MTSPRPPSTHARARLRWTLGLCLLGLGVGACRLFGGSATAQDDRPTDAEESVATGSPALQAELDAAVKGVSDPALAELVREHWAEHLRQSPVAATRLGVHDYDDRLGDQSPLAIEKRKLARGGLLARAGDLDASRLSAADQETLELLKTQLGSEVELEVCRGHEWNVGVQRNPVSDALDLHEGFRLVTKHDAANLVARYRASAVVIDQEIDSLSRGAADGLFASRRSLERLVELVDRQLAVPIDDWALLEPAGRLPEDWFDDRDKLARELRAAVTDDVAPAFQRYRDYVAAELVPNARGPEAPGISALPIGAACYEASIRHHTTLSLGPQQVHDIGLEEIARIDEEIATLGRALFRTKTLAATLERLREDKSLYFDTSDAVEAAAVAGLEAAKYAMPRFFGTLPQADCVVRRVPDFEAPQTHIGYYEPPHADGSKPGEYFVNTYAPTTRPRYEARVLAVHEAIPGHHLQTAIAQELEGLPSFRRHAGYSAFVEGWALYTERLAEEMGLYESDLDRIGMLSFDAWRAARLVVDTGIHVLGWTRAEAEAFLLEHTAATRDNIANEVDRYIGWPGQALAYKLGQRHIWDLRRDAETKLGDAFDLSRFHDVVLSGGPVPLQVLTRRVEAWVATGGG